MASSTCCYRASLLASALVFLAPTAASANLFLNDLKESRIIDGDTAEEDRYPYSVSLEDGGGHFCGGSLIGKNVVLTAAHCLGDPFSVRIGSDEVGEGELIEADKMVEHPDYDSNTDENDIAVVFLKESTSLNVPLVKLNSDGSYPPVGSTAVTMGWGDTDASGTTRLPKDLQAVDLRVISNQECDDAEEDGEDYNGWIYESMVCTYTDGKDACQGDSGGPLIIKGNSVDEDTQVGIVSWGVGCAFLPGVFARVSSGYDWIRTTVCDGDDTIELPGHLCGTPEPTNQPTATPTTATPTKKPTLNPTKSPTKQPTLNPTKSPTKQPTNFPTTSPSAGPTASPSVSPTRGPTVSPTTATPTFSPTESPTDSPSVSSMPTGSPSASPTDTTAPSAEPTESPSVSSRPSRSPSSSPSVSVQPSVAPSISQSPTVSSSEAPSISSSPTISSAPSSMPSTSTQPSSAPSSVPSSSPSKSSSPTVTSSPTSSSPPTQKPTAEPRSFVDFTGQALLIPDQEAVAETLGEDDIMNNSHRLGGSFAFGALLSAMISAWLML